MKNQIIKHALTNAALTALYIAAVASFLFYVPHFLGADQKADTVLIPIAMLLLFVFSAGLTGFLVFGRPVLWYLDGNKKEALSLLGYTLGGLLIIMVIVLLVSLLTF
jgi:hypothetical protein